MSNGVLEGEKGSWVRLSAVRANRMRDWCGNRNRNGGGAHGGKIDATCHMSYSEYEWPLWTKMTFMQINSHRSCSISPSVSSLLFTSLPCNRHACIARSQGHSNREVTVTTACDWLAWWIGRSVLSLESLELYSECFYTISRSDNLLKRNVSEEERPFSLCSFYSSVKCALKKGKAKEGRKEK